MDETLIDGDVRPLAQSGHRLEIGPPASDARVTRGGGRGRGPKKKSNDKAIVERAKGEGEGGCYPAKRQ